jgi:hypothetical protein
VQKDVSSQARSTRQVRRRRRRSKSRRRNRRLLITVLLLVTAFALFRLAASRRHLMQARTALADARTELAGGKVPAALDAFATAEARLNSARAEGGFPVSLLNPVPLVGSPGRAVRDTVKAGRHVVAAGRALARAEDAFPIHSHSGLNGSNLAPLHQSTLDARVPLEEAGRELAQAKRELKGPAGAALPLVSAPATSVLPLLDQTEGQLRGAKRGLNLFADLTAPETDARILILNQDTLEARPAGGFIGTFGVLHFLHGTVALEHYGAAGELQYPSPPMPVPTDLVDWLNGHPWELSNIGWFPDFPSTALLAREMYKRQGGGEVAGVVGITQELLAPLIAHTGPVDLPGYGTVGADKLEDRIIQEVELKTPQDVPKHKFLDLLSQTLFDRLLHLEPAKLGDVAAVAGHAAASGDIQAWFADPAREEDVAGTTWSGALPHTDGDFLMVADANMWASKANKDLVRNVTYSVSRDDKGRLVGHVHAVYRNNGPKTRLNPTYLAYVRVYAPFGARLIGGAAPNADKYVVGGPPRDLGAAPDGPYRVFSTLQQADPQSEATFDIRYTLPESVLAGGQYSLTWVRQPGSGNDRIGATVLGRSMPVTATDRTADLDIDLNPHGLRGFLHRRWIFRQLGA